MMFNVLQAAAGLDPMLADSLAGNVAPAAPETMTQSFSLIQMAAKGGWLMIILAILSTPQGCEHRPQLHARHPRLHP